MTSRVGAVRRLGLLFDLVALLDLHWSRSTLWGGGIDRAMGGLAWTAVIWIQVVKAVTAVVVALIPTIVQRVETIEIRSTGTSIRV